MWASPSALKATSPNASKKSLCADSPPSKRKNSHTKLNISEVLEQLVGKACVEVYGGCWGSHVSIILGATKTLSLQFNLEGTATRLDLLKSDFEISIQDCRWAIYEGSKHLADQDTQNGMGSQMYRSLQKLIGKEVTSIDLDASANLTVRFNDDLWIEANCQTGLSDEQNYYHFLLGKLEVSIGRDCIPTCQNRENLK